MKFSLSLALVLSATISAEKVSYFGDKAYRIAVGDASLELTDIINELGLETWKGVNDGVAVANSFVDLVVPAGKGMFEINTSWSTSGRVKAGRMQGSFEFLGIHIDLLLVAKFAELSEGFEVEVMHEDLGLSIQEEGENIVPYIGMFPRIWVDLCIANSR